MPARVAIDVSLPCARWRRSLPGAALHAQRAARAALAGARLEGKRAELSLVLADDGLVRRLNRRWRGRDRPTNVLSFPAESPPGAPLMLGDVVLAFETVRREAK